MEKKFERRPPVRGKRDGKPVRAKSYRSDREGDSERPRRSYSRGSDGDSERPRRSYSRGNDSGSERPRRSYSRGNDSGSERPRRSYSRGSDGDSERPRRSYSRGNDGDSERPRRSDARGNDGDSERRRRSYARGSDGDSERPRRSYSRGNDGDSERPRRSYSRGNDGDNERPRRSYSRGNDGDSERPRRSYSRGSDGDSERPRRSYSDRDYSEKKSTPGSEKTISNIVRLNKFISNSGICSRREADEYIQTGLVTVNGVIVTELGTKVNVNDDIRFNGERLKGEKKVYLLMNKPKDYVTTLSDPHAEDIVTDLISPEMCPERVFPVGRLDKATTGVLLFTNDGDLAEKLVHPSFGVKKIYHVFLDKNLTKNDFDAILKGIVLEDGEIHADTLSYVDEDMSQVGIEIHSGRNRIVRRIFESLGYDIKKLDRVYFAGLTKKNLRRGEWRLLTDHEVALL